MNTTHDPLYREVILEHWRNPQNYGVIENASIQITNTNPLCGDEMCVMMNIKNNRITAITFTSQGCAISKASASIFTEKVKNAPISSIKEITSQQVLDDLEIILSPSRIKCALLIYSTIKNALNR